MKTKQKKALAFLLCAALVLALCPAALAEGEEAPQTTGPWKIGEKQYSTFAAAVADVPTNTATTIELTDDTTCDGAIVHAGQNITVKLGGHTFNVSGPTVGSTGTETNGFQFLQGSTVTFQDGTLHAVADSGARIFIQNYCNLTLDNVEVDASECSTVQYAVSNNNDTTYITGTTSILAPEGQVAFDCYYKLGMNYTDVTVIVDTIGEIRGKIEYDYKAKNVSNVDDVPANAKIVIYSGTFMGEVSLPKLQNQTDKVNITVNGGTFNADNRDSFAPYVPEGNTLVPNENGEYTLGVAEDAVAKVGGKGYDSLQAAINAAKAGETVKLLNDTKENVTIASGSFTLDLNGKTLDGGTTKGTAALTNNGGNVVITDSVGGGQIKRSDIDKAGCYYTILNNSGTLEIAGGKVYNHAGGDQPTPWSGASLICNGPHTEATLIISGGHIEQDNFIAVKNDECGILKITGGTITSKTQSVQNWCDAELSGGTLTGAVLTCAYSNKAGNTAISGNCVINGDVESYWYREGAYVAQPGVIPSVEIKGGTINGKLAKVSTADGTNAQPEDNADERGKITVSGGTFTRPVPDEFCAPGYHPEELENGRYGVSDTYHTGTTGSGLVSGGIVIGTGTNTGTVTDPSLLPPQTGDASVVGIAAALLLLASCGMAGLALRRSAKKREMN